MIGPALAPVATYAADSDSDQSNPVIGLKDSAITAKIKVPLAAEHLGSMKHVTVDTHSDGGVWMTGTANSHQDWTRPPRLHATPRASNRSTAI